MTSAPRVCGDCRVCCNVLAIQKLDKGPGEWCRHACGSGCGIYERRPKECADYACVWLQSQSGESALPEWMRPDNSGIHLDATLDGENIVARPAPGKEARLERGRGRDFLVALSHRVGVVIVRKGVPRDIIERGHQRPAAYKKDGLTWKARHEVTLIGR